MMDGEHYRVHADIIVYTSCPNCGNEMFQIFTILGLRDTYVCPNCKNAYKMKLVKIPNKQIDVDVLESAIKNHKEKVKK